MEENKAPLICYEVPRVEFLELNAELGFSASLEGVSDDGSAW